MKEFSLEEYLKNPNREVVTRDGRKVRIVCTDFDNSDYPVVGEIKGYKWPLSFATNGLLIKDGVEQPSDLFFAPEKHERWINVYGNSVYYPGTQMYNTEQEAKEMRGTDACVATVKVEWME